MVVLAFWNFDFEIIVNNPRPQFESVASCHLQLSAERSELRINGQVKHQLGPSQTSVSRIKNLEKVFLYNFIQFDSGSMIIQCIAASH